MDKAVTKWLEAIANEELNPEDVERSLRYAKDLEQGLAKIRTFSQGVRPACQKIINGVSSPISWATA